MEGKTWNACVAVIGFFRAAGYGSVEWMYLARKRYLWRNFSILAKAYLFPYDTEDDFSHFSNHNLIKHDNCKWRWTGND